MPGPHEDGDELMDEMREQPGAFGEEEPLPEGEPREPGRFTRFRRRILDRRDITDDARYLLGTMWETSDRAKSEVIKMLGREVRNYLEGMQVKDDIKDLITSHSLEVRASFHLKPLADLVDDEDEDEDEGEEEWDEGEEIDEGEESGVDDEDEE